MPTVRISDRLLATLSTPPRGVLFCCFFGLLTSMNPSYCGAQESVPLQTENDYRSEILQWRQDNESRLQEPFGWLSLTGNFWLDEGENRIGSGNSDKIKIPEHLPNVASGAFHVNSSTVELRVDPPYLIQVNGESKGTFKLSIDPSQAESDGTDTIAIGERFRLQLVRRNGRFAVRVRDRENPSFQKFQGKKWYDIAPDFRTVATFTPYEPARTIPVINVKGESVDTTVVGLLKFRIRDRDFQLDAFSDSSESLFIVFKDQTSGRTTYAPGRFLTTAAPVAGQVTLDFNKAVNPPCAFSPHALCPLPPKQNHLDIEVTAGELKYE